MGSLLTHTRMFSIEDRIAAPWHYLPVEVPAAASALRVTPSFPRESGAVLDLGCFGPSRFRGWSEGARDTFVVSELGATPGYLAGPVESGLWRVVVGLHLLPESGVPFTVTAKAVDASDGELMRTLAAASAVEPMSGAARAYLAGRGGSGGRTDAGRPSVRGTGLVGAPDATAAAVACGVALVVARPVVDDAAVLVAGAGRVAISAPREGRYCCGSRARWRLPA